MKKKYMICKLHLGGTHEDPTIDITNDINAGYFDSHADAEKWINENGKGLAKKLTIMEFFE